MLDTINKVPQISSVINNRKVFLIVLGTKGYSIKVPTDLVSFEGLLPVT